MIRIKKPAQVPSHPSEDGAPGGPATLRAVRLDADAYESGHKTSLPRFDSGIYGQKSVKDALQKAQHDKCAFCESKITHIAYGDVEHFRPKAGYRQEPKDPLVRPGYYWLAYEWSNLLFCCQLCNQRFKGNHFPLADADPSAEVSPRRHRDRSSRCSSTRGLRIRRTSWSSARDVIARSTTTLAARRRSRSSGSNRGGLDGNRLRRFSWFRHLIPHVEQLIRLRDTDREIGRGENPSPEGRKDLAKVEADLEEFVGDSAEYAAMIRAALRARARR